MKIAVLGLGQVGKSLLKVFSSGLPYYKTRYKADLEIVLAADSHHMISGEEAIDPVKLLHLKEKGNILDAGFHEIDRESLFDQNFDILVDLMPATEDGKRARDLYINAFKQGISVVTACKSGLANHWGEIMSELKGTDARILYEATVAGGLPFFSFLNYCTRSSNVTAITGIISSSANFLLKRSAAGRSFEESLDDARSKGTLETNYHFDTLGFDSAWKTVIVADSIFGQKFSPQDIVFEGIEEVVNLRKANRNLRLVSNVSRAGSSVDASSRLVELQDGDPLLNLGEGGLGFTATFDNRTPLTVTEMFDGPTDTANGVMNDLLLLR